MLVVDSCIHAGWIIPIKPQHAVYENYTLVMDKGKILDICPTSQAKKRYQAQTVYNKPKHILLPGLINGHSHAAMNLLRGLADDLSLMTWLQDHIWPAETQWVSEDFVSVGTQLAIAEMIRSGTTSFNDMYFFPDIVAKNAEQAGVRAQVGAVIFDFPCAWGDGPNTYFQKAEQLLSDFQNHPLVTPNIGPHAPYTVSDENLKRTRQFADKHHCRINIHLHETQKEVDDSRQQFGCTPVSRLHNLGFLGEDVIAVHMTALDEADLELVTKIKPKIVTCPESNLKLASGLCNSHQLRTLGLTVGIGTDGAASNNDLDMFSEMRSAAFVSKFINKDPSAGHAADILSMATLDGAKVIGLDDKIGSLEINKEADLIAIDTDNIESTPLYHPISQLVYSQSREHITDVWVAGKQLMADKKLKTINEEELLTKAVEWQKRLQEFA